MQSETAPASHPDFPSHLPLIHHNISFLLHRYGLGIWPDLCRPDAIIIKGEHVYVGTGDGDNALYRFNKDGSNRQKIGGGSDAFGYPHGIHLDSEGCFYVSDPVAQDATATPSKYSPV